MKNMKRYILFAISTLTILSSCEKVIDIDLNNSDPKLVVEAIITNSNGPHTVLLSESSDFDSNIEFKGVPNALVIISDNRGIVDTLKMQTAGVYQTNKIIGTPGHTYFLTIIHNGQQYTAKSSMPQLVKMDTLLISEFELLGQKQVVLNPSISDPIDTKNYYRFKLIQNGIPSQQLLAGNDQYFNGISREFNINPGGRMAGEVKKGDVFQLELMCIDEEAYNYFSTLELTLDQNSATPANPKSNIQGGCLGYFSAHSTSTRTVVYE